ncbi:ABC transporter permease [Natronobacterium gregoryi]|uniref:ABC transporter permease n=2 Tax=Natronobacterium gregoryi TaxID=44930 RepID=L0AHN9_NATGS|nr:ABC transporter permease [Natronobacterium gregoryi]AFZ72657.1 ABC-type dipeptide/oligopeptide/nickel transport system, permease component [Natronobacterium gregoryi SP2]ELY69055.1 binding-protein-dependent transport system inner membrane protein [Natronobacterium gregoryi SP2]PLK20609.1 ABC transporter permease [Natronobacterium gregoryi SP2]SFI90834.1 peptide/nickel transport system permease protein [Natronobacterium gregoryi]
MSRWRYLLRRILLSIPVIVFGLTITFIIIRMGPIDPVSAILGQDAGPGQRVQIEQRLGLDRPLWEQYFEFMSNMLLPWSFDLGQSWVVQPNTDVTTLLRSYAPRTLWLGFWSVLIPLFIGIPLGFYAGLNSNTWGDYVASFGGIIWRAMPNFWLAIMFLAFLRQTEQFLFGLDWHTFIVEIDSLVGPPPLDFFAVTDWATVGVVSIPIGIYFSFETFLASVKQVLPAAIVLGSASMGNELRIGRTAVLETINSNYVETAKAKGLRDRVIVWKHVFRNALIPLVPIITNEAFILLGGSVIVEYIFGINGIGYLFFQAATQGDLPLVGSLMFVFIIIIVSINILQDVLYTILDPRVGYQG